MSISSPAARLQTTGLQLCCDSAPDFSLLPRLASPSCRGHLGGRHSDGMLPWLRMLPRADQPLLRPWSAVNGGAAALAWMPLAVPPMLGRAASVAAGSRIPSCRCGHACASSAFTAVASVRSAPSSETRKGSLNAQATRNAWRAAGSRHAHRPRCQRHPRQRRCPEWAARGRLRALPEDQELPLAHERATLSRLPLDARRSVRPDLRDDRRAGRTGAQGGASYATFPSVRY